MEVLKLLEIVLILETEVENLFTISLSWLALGIWTVNSFYVALMDLSKSQFITNLGLSNKDHNYCHTCTVFKLEKNTGFSPSFY